MTCVIVGPPEEAEKLGLPDTAAVVAPEAFQTAVGQMTRAVIIAPRLLTDRDILQAAQVPLAIVPTNPTDVVHLEMHIRNGRLCLTPCDAILVDDRLASRFFAPWIDLVPLAATGLADFITHEAPTPIHPVPAGFETLPKAALSEIAAQMRVLKLAQYDSVIGSSTACRSLIGTAGNLANAVLAEIEALPRNTVLAEADAVADQLAPHADCRVLICPAIIDDENPVEKVNLTVTTATQVPINLVQLVSGTRLPRGRLLTYLIYAIG